MNKKKEKKKEKKKWRKNSAKHVIKQCATFIYFCYKFRNWRYSAR